MTAVLLSGKPKPRPPLKVGDRVTIVTRCGVAGPDLTGWILNLVEGRIRVASVQEDDGRPNPPEDWWRATFLLSEVQVIR